MKPYTIEMALNEPNKDIARGLVNRLDGGDELFVTKHRTIDEISMIAVAMCSEGIIMVRPIEQPMSRADYYGELSDRAYDEYRQNEIDNETGD